MLLSEFKTNAGPVVSTVMVPSFSIVMSSPLVSTGSVLSSLTIIWALAGQLKPIAIDKTTSELAINRLLRSFDNIDIY